MTRITRAQAKNLGLLKHAPVAAQDGSGRTKRAKNASPHTRRGANPETALQSAIADALRYVGCYVERRNSGAIKTQTGGLVRLAPVGTPDLFVILPGGRAGFVEVKMPGNSPTAAQHACHEDLRRYGAVVVVAHSIEEAMEGLEMRAMTTLPAECMLPKPLK